MLNVQQLNGFGSGGPVTLVSFLASAQSAAHTIVVPAPAAAGDLAVLLDYGASSATPVADVIPTNWTGVVTDSTAGFESRLRVSYKKLVTGDGGSTITGMNSDEEDDKVMLVFRANVPITHVVASAWNAQTSTGNPIQQEVTAVGVAVPLIVIGMAAHSLSTAAFTVATPAFDATVASSDADIITGYTIYNAAPADHSIDMGDLGNYNALASGYLQLF